ncbi:hypothetical protein J2Z64_000617 [Oceanobacillus polygoni]|uniref:Uncharacterized protein n=1 Tax=Oceanobacillus polygoni TaxID=1235259 RepID=A0A9X1CDN5_9BACI|nr:hypothetical protein [Oceanobacillus polygoni]
MHATESSMKTEVILTIVTGFIIIRLNNLTTLIRISSNFFQA